MNVAQASRRASFEWTYVIATIATFVFSPEARRLVDWRGSYDPLNTFAVIPLLMLLPIAVFAYRRRANVPSRTFNVIVFIWLAGFAYAAFVALAYGALLQVLPAAAQFCLPISVGGWLMTLDEPMEFAHKRFARVLLICGAIAGAYGIVQYVFAPPWDTAWMQNLGADSFGDPERFAIRVYSTLNGPGVFALFMGAVILFNLPYLRIRSWLNMCALLLITVSLILSLVRLAWLTVAVGIVIFVVLSPRRLQALLSLGSVVVLCGAATLLFILLSPNASLSTTLSNRVGTLSDIQDDGSTLQRRETTDEAVQDALDQPEGGGLGLVSSGGKFGASDAQVYRRAPARAVDSGFATRFIEMGLPGLLAWLIACCASILLVARAYIQFAASRNRGAMLVAASCLATLITIFALNIGGDNQQNLLGVVFFAALAFPLMRSNYRTANSDPGVPDAPFRRTRSAGSGFRYHPSQ